MTASDKRTNQIKKGLATQEPSIQVIRCTTRQSQFWAVLAIGVRPFPAHIVDFRGIAANGSYRA